MDNFASIRLQIQLKGDKPLIKTYDDDLGWADTKEELFQNLDTLLLNHKEEIAENDYKFATYIVSLDMYDDKFNQWAKECSDKQKAWIEEQKKLDKEKEE